jgi:hypothetical protein
VNCAGSPGTVRYPRLTGLSAPPRWGRFLGSGQGFWPRHGASASSASFTNCSARLWPFRFKFMNARADRRLADVKSIRGSRNSTHLSRPSSVKVIPRRRQGRGAISRGNDDPRRGCPDSCSVRHCVGRVQLVHQQLCAPRGVGFLLQPRGISPSPLDQIDGEGEKGTV